MAAKSMAITPLSQLLPGQESDTFALMSAKEELTTRDGKPYFRVAFRDSNREVSFPIWGDSPWAEDCLSRWSPGTFYKLRAVYRETNFGPQLDIRRIREVVDEDQDDGFDPAMCRPCSRFDVEEMYGQLWFIVGSNISESQLLELVRQILTTYREPFCTRPAAQRNHHAYASGLLEHTLSVVRTAIYFADKYTEYYPDMQPSLNKDLVVAGAALHDIGKVLELDETATGAEYTPAGELIGHILQGRDIVRAAAATVDVHSETLLRLEHIIVSHQRLPEWGSPKPPMTPEALLVHYADDVDAKYHMVYSILREESGARHTTSNRNVLRQKIYRGPLEPGISGA